MAETVLTNMIMLEKNGRVLVIDRIKRFPGIAFPGGKTESGESIYDSAIREFQEETVFSIYSLRYFASCSWLLSSRIAERACCSSLRLMVAVATRSGI